MDGRRGSEGTPGHRRKLGKSVWVWYLTAGTVLAVARVALFVWVNHQFASDIRTETTAFIAHWLYPEGVVSILWGSLVAFVGTKYYLAWCSLVTAGSFVMATPILLAGWLRHRRRTHLGPS